MSNIRSPKEVFKKKIAEDLDSSSRSKVKEESKAVKSPKIFFREEKVAPVEEVQLIPDQSPVEDMIADLSVDVAILKESVVETKKYNTEINFIKRYVKQLEKDISNDNQFDPSNIYEGLTRIRQDIQKVRSEIPTIPEPISYDKEFNDLTESIDKVRSEIPTVPEIKYYDEDIDNLLESITGIKDQIDNFPEIKYYDEEVNSIEEKLVEIRTSITELPEVKYYDSDIEMLQEKLEAVRESIPTVPEVKYYDDQVEDLESKCSTLKEMIENLPELPEVKYYDNDVDDLYKQIKTIKGTIKRLPAPKYYDTEVKSIYETIESVKESIPEMPDIPEIKYYDEEVEILEKDVSLLFKKLSAIKIPDIKPHQKKLSNFYDEFNERNSVIDSKLEHLESVLLDVYNVQQERLERELIEEETQKIKEEITDEPAENKTEDPLTPLKQEFVTFKQLRDHYQLFIRRIQTQLSTVGGGNEITTIKGLDDVIGIATNGAAYDGMYLRYSHSTQTVEPEPVIDTLKGLVDVVGIATNGVAYDGKYLRYDDSTKTFTAETIIGESGDFSGTLTGLFDTDITNLQDGYLMVYNSNTGKFVFVDPQTYFGINADASPDPNVVDYGTYN